MMTQPQSEIDNFQQWLETCYGEVARDSLEKIRIKAWDHFNELGLPTKKSEVFRYVKLRNLYDRKFSPAKPTEVAHRAISPHVLPECEEAVLVFVNGFFQPQLSRTNALPKKVVATSLIEAMKTYGTFLNNQWAKSIKEETDPFAALNAALHQGGLFLYLPPRTILERPLQILNLVDTQSNPYFMQPRFHLFAATQSQLEICSTQATLSGKGCCINMAADFSIEEDAHVRYVQASFDEPEDSWHFDALRAHLKRNSTLQTINATAGGTTVRYDYRIALNGENGEALLNGIWMLNGKAEAHTHVLMDHQAPYCRSFQLYKGVLNDVSHSSFEGKILVRQPAQKTDAFQLNNNLLLSDRAAADSKPNLEIFADDVKASHGATVGQLDKEQLFYMKTRGFEEAQAKNLLVQGFCEEVIQKIQVPSLRESISARASSYLIGG